MQYAIYVVSDATTDALQHNRNLWLTKQSKSRTNSSRGTCLFRSFNSDNVQESSQPLSVLVHFLFYFVKFVLDISFIVELGHTNYIMHLTPISQLINLYTERTPVN